MYGMSRPSRKSVASRNSQSAKPEPGLASSGFSHASGANERGGGECWCVSDRRVGPDSGRRQQNPLNSGPIAYALIGEGSAT
jgi:hypothetical protein